MLLLVGPALQAELGALGFLLLYLAGGVLANLAAYVWNSAVKKRRRWTFQARLPSLLSKVHNQGSVSSAQNASREGDFLQQGMQAAEGFFSKAYKQGREQSSLKHQVQR